MANLSPEQIVDYYAGLMEHIKFRLRVLGNAITGSKDDDSIQHAIISAEMGYLQVRKICETLALATLIAHNQINAAKTQHLAKQYSADAIFGMLANRVNPEGFPQAVARLDGRNITLAGAESPGRSEINAMYRRAHDLLHTGRLRELLAGAEIHLNFPELTEFHNRLIALLDMHVIALPEISTILLCFLSHKESNGRAFVQMSPAKRHGGRQSDPAAVRIDQNNQPRRERRLCKGGESAVLSRRIIHHFGLLCHVYYCPKNRQAPRDWAILHARNGVSSQNLTKNLFGTHIADCVTAGAGAGGQMRG